MGSPFQAPVSPIAPGENRTGLPSSRDQFPTIDELEMPGWWTGWREGQWEVIQEIVGHFNAGKRWVVYSGPVGSGKSLVGDVVRQVLRWQAFQRYKANRVSEPVAVTSDSSTTPPPPRCYRCHRELHDEVSIARGFGPECIRYIKNPQAYIAAVERSQEARRFMTEQDHAAPAPKAIPDMDIDDYHYRTAYLVTTINLQNQLARDFKNGGLLMGRKNYRTGDFADAFPMINAADCDKSRGSSCDKCDLIQRGADEKHCSFCCTSGWENCPYEKAKWNALASPMLITNLAYFLTEANHVGKTGGQNLMIIDEAEQAEDALMSFVEVAISARRMKKLGLGLPEKKTVASSWGPWVKEQAIPAVEQAILNLPQHPKELADKRELKRLGLLLDGLKSLRNLDDGNWVLDDYQRGGVTFKPVKVDRFGNMLWNHGKQFLLMSATVISPEVLADSLGIEPDAYAYVEAPSRFPVRRRPIYIRPVADMSKKADERGKCLVEAAKIIRERPDSRVLVHAVSYSLTSFLGQGLRKLLPGRTIVWYENSEAKEEALQVYGETEGAVIVAPSLSRGLDLADDLCRCVIIAKVGFPNLGDKQINARLYSRGGSTWYATQTVRTLVQQTGRGMRGKTDYCETFILDAQMTRNIWKKSKHLLPPSWVEAIDWYERWPVEKD